MLNARDRLNEPKENEENNEGFEPRSQTELYEKMQALVDEVLGKQQQPSDFNVDPEPVRVFFRPKKAAQSESALHNLQRIQRYMTMLDKYNKQLVKLNEENARYVSFLGKKCGVNFTKTFRERKFFLAKTRSFLKEQQLVTIKGC